MCSLCRLPVAKNHNFGQILAFLGAPVSTPFYQWGPNLVCYSRPTVYVYLRNSVSIGLFCRPVAANDPNFCHFLPFFGLQHLVMSPLGINLRKLSMGAQLRTFPYPTASKSFLYSKAFMANRAHKLWRPKAWRTDRQTDRQTDKQTKKLNVFGHPGGGWNPSPTKHGMMIEDLEHVLAPRKLFRVWRIV